MKAIAPHRLFLVFALIYGLLLAFLVPPMGGGDEQHHFLRSYEILSGQWMGNSEGPAGIRRFQDSGINLFFPSLTEKHYPRASFSALFDIALEPERQVSQNINKMFVGQFPLAHMLYMPAMAAGIALDMKPLNILYLCRITGMLFSTLLIYVAIRIAPLGGYILCAIALLPTAVFYRSFIHTDALMMGIAFLFFALLSRLMMEEKPERKNHDLFWLAALACVIAPLKTGYVFVAFLSLLIPKRTFGDAHKYWLSQAVVILPGIALTAAWLLMVNHVHGSSLTYSTWAGKDVNPSLQIANMLERPFDYISVLAHYIFSFSNVMMWIAGAIAELGWSIVYLPPYAYLALIMGLFFVVFFEPARLPVRLCGRAKILIAGVFIGTILLIMTLLYIAFNPVGGLTIASFQGRYFLPILPFLAWLLPPQKSPAPAKATLAVALTSLFGLTAAALTLAGLYYR